MAPEARELVETVRDEWNPDIECRARPPEYCSGLSEALSFHL
jgi:hypothetical protein